MNMVDIIEKKKNGQSLSSSEIDFFIHGYVEGNIPDYQVSALLMAIYFQGFDAEETLALTKAMIQSGEIMNLDDINGVLVDKHSSGGVGDSVSLILAPILAACGLKVAKMSGRGLGFTGGTLDKLESIPGVRVRLDPIEFSNVVNQVGLSICGQTGNLTPADKKLYALRDVTATIDIMPMIASSIISKKLALRSDALLLDVKVGSGAFMKTKNEAEKLASEMLRIGRRFGRNVKAVITNMDEPLGFKIGNALEVEEALDCLKGFWPSDMKEIVYFIASELLLMTKIASHMEDAFKKIDDSIQNDTAFHKFQEMIFLQGGPQRIDKNILPKAKYKYELFSDQTGFVKSIHATTVGKTALQLGAGRATIEDVLSYGAGIELKKKVDDFVVEGEILAILYADESDRFEDAMKLLRSAFSFSDHFGHKKKMILKVL